MSHFTLVPPCDYEAVHVNDDSMAPSLLEYKRYLNHMPVLQEKQLTQSVYRVDCAFKLDRFFWLLYSNQLTLPRALQRGVQQELAYENARNEGNNRSNSKWTSNVPSIITERGVESF